MMIRLILKIIIVDDLFKSPDHLFENILPTLEPSIVEVPLVFLWGCCCGAQILRNIFVFDVRCSMLDALQILQHGKNDKSKVAIHAPSVVLVDTNSYSTLATLLIDPVTDLVKPSLLLMITIEPARKLVLDGIFFAIVVVLDPEEDEIG
jgi:hypothetical protein